MRKELVSHRQARSRATVDSLSEGRKTMLMVEGHMQTISVTSPRRDVSLIVRKCDKIARVTQLTGNGSSSDQRTQCMGEDENDGNPNKTGIQDMLS